MPHTVVFGCDKDEHLEVQVLGLDDALLDNVDWLLAQVSVAVGSFRGQFYCDIGTEAFSQFLPQLRQLAVDPKGVATFSSAHGQFQFVIRGSGWGTFDVQGHAFDHEDGGNKLTWSFIINQTQLRSAIASVAAISTAYPAVQEKDVQRGAAADDRPQAGDRG